MANPCSRRHASHDAHDTHHSQGGKSFLYATVRDAATGESWNVFEICSHTSACDPSQTHTLRERLGVTCLHPDEFHAFLLLAMGGFDRASMRAVVREVRLGPMWPQYFQY